MSKQLVEARLKLDDVFHDNLKTKDQQWLEVMKEIGIDKIISVEKVKMRWKNMVQSARNPSKTDQRRRAEATVWLPMMQKYLENDPTYKPPCIIASNSSQIQYNTNLYSHAPKADNIAVTSPTEENIYSIMRKKYGRPKKNSNKKNTVEIAAKAPSKRINNRDLLSKGMRVFSYNVSSAISYRNVVMKELHILNSLLLVRAEKEGYDVESLKKQLDTISKTFEDKSKDENFLISEDEEAASNLRNDTDELIGTSDDEKDQDFEMVSSRGSIIGEASEQRNSGDLDGYDDEDDDQVDATIESAAFKQPNIPDSRKKF